LLLLYIMVTYIFQKLTISSIDIASTNPIEMTIIKRFNCLILRSVLFIIPDNTCTR